MMRVPTLLLAAGASSRMRGTDKLLVPVDGVPLLRERATTALEVGPVFVTLPPGSSRRAVLEGLDLTVVETQAKSGLSVSLRAGIAALPEGVDGALVLLADMPEITVTDLLSVKAAFAAAPNRPIACGGREDGKPGHPVLLPARVFGDLATVEGDRGARALIQAEGALVVPLPPGHASTDLDTPEAWVEWRARTGR